MKGIYMNINFNLLFKKLLPFIYLVVVAFLLANIIFLFLPKNGIDFVNEKYSSLDYQKYNFYSKIKTEKKDEKESFSATKEIQTLAKYNLKAIYYINNKTGWITIEETSGDKSYILSQNEEIDGYILLKLFQNYVIFEKNKKEFKLELNEKESIDKYEIQNNSNQEIIQKDRGAVVNREYLNSYISNVDKIWNNISINEIKNGDKIEGFKITKINKNSVFSKLGLQEGDVIKSINNKVLDSYSEAFNIYNNMGNVMDLNMEILRNNEVMELNYEIN